jgi:LuxR family transcriptional regulator of spore coat protein
LPDTYLQKKYASQGFCEFPNDGEQGKLRNYADCVGRPRLMTKPRLTGREVQCLEWVSKGKTSWETGLILGLTERTVNFHLRNACTKLKVYGRQAGVAQALRLGLLDASYRSEHPERTTQPNGAPTIA